jgi:16S rRNA (uracil1498-N3)-methyltransferase
MRAGEALVAFDGHGLEVDVRIVRADRDGTLVEPVGEVRERRPPFAVHLLLGVPKGPAMDDAVRMATEAGMTHLHPLHTERAVPRGEKTDRWERIAASAAEQCGRADVPSILPPCELAEGLARVADVPDRRVALPGSPGRSPATGPVAVLVGPEGGLSEAEVRRALQAGFVPMGLARFVLRACTAAGVAVAAVAGPERDGGR